jgi:glucose-1-phosphate thymidylyltransferase
MEKRTSLKIACIEEIALRMNYIDRIQFEKNIEALGKSSYAEYLRGLRR